MLARMNQSPLKTGTSLEFRHNGRDFDDIRPGAYNAGDEFTVGCRGSHWPDYALLFAGRGPSARGTLRIPFSGKSLRRTGTDSLRSKSGQELISVSIQSKNTP